MLTKFEGIAYIDIMIIRVPTPTGPNTARIGQSKVSRRVVD